MPRDELSRDLDDQNATVAAARAAQAREDWAEAARLWIAYCDRFSDDPGGFISAAEMLQKLSRGDEADEILARGVRLHPSNVPLRAAHARIAERGADWAQAAARWQIFLDRFPEEPVGYTGASNALSQMAQAQLRQADEVLRKGMERFPRNGDVLGSHARFAASRLLWPEALARWQSYLERLADDPTGYVGACNVTCELGRLDEAEAFARQGLAKFPDHHGLLSAYARIANERHDWPEALRRWTTFRERFPNDPEGHNRVRLVLNELGRFAEADRGFEEALSRLAPDKSRAELFLRFESLGDNCEFGVVQRYFGANPLGLLRFTHTPSGLLRDALDAKFRGVGEPENTILFASRGEWITQDTRYHMAMHTQLRESANDRDRTFGLICRRLQYLRDKLLTDLTEAQKHLVYACGNPLPDDEVRPIWRALRDYGDNRLLFVRPADDAHPPGMLRRIERGLIIGYIDQLSVDNPSYDLWLQMCKEADSILLAEMAEFGELIEPVENTDLDI
jgi:tetratricopeptide (TPR) repeat protein